jgi:hypothetical protein
MPVRVPLEFAKPTMRLAVALADADGRLLAGKGTPLDERVVRALRKLAIQTALVEDSGDLQPWETVGSLAEELQALEARFEKGIEGPETPEMSALHRAIERYLRRRWERLAGAPATLTDAAHGETA